MARRLVRVPRHARHPAAAHDARRAGAAGDAVGARPSGRRHTPGTVREERAAPCTCDSPAFPKEGTGGRRRAVFRASTPYAANNWPFNKCVAFGAYIVANGALSATFRGL